MAGVGRRSFVLSGVSGVVGLVVGSFLGANFINARAVEERVRYVTETRTQTTTALREITVTQTLTPTQQKIHIKIGDTKGIGRAPFYVALEKKNLR